MVAWEQPVRLQHHFKMKLVTYQSKMQLLMFHETLFLVRKGQIEVINMGN